MTIETSLEIAIERTGIERYRYLCLEHPTASVRAEYSALVHAIAKQPEPPRPPAIVIDPVGRVDGAAMDGDGYPPLLEQAGNALGALGRPAGAVLTGQAVMVSSEERERRWAICTACEHLKGDRCDICGCHMRAKTALAQESCPILKWSRIEATS